MSFRSLYFKAYNSANAKFPVLIISKNLIWYEIFIWEIFSDVYNQCKSIVKVVYEKMRKRRKWSAAAFDADFCAPVKKSKKNFHLFRASNTNFLRFLIYEVKI